jgi:hypothetical protein
MFPPSAGSVRDGQLFRINDGAYPEFLGFVKENRQDADNVTVGLAVFAVRFENYAGDRHCLGRPSISV